MDVKGKTAIILGGTSGIGLATANRLSGLGTKVVAEAKAQRKLIEAGEPIPQRLRV
mgnify:CR=1 FL=1